MNAGGQYLHRLKEKTGQDWWVHPSHSPANPTVHHKNKAQDYSAMTKADSEEAKYRREELAELLGVSCESLIEIGVGFSDIGGDCWTFPERDALGSIIGINRRFESGEKKAIGNRGLTYSSKWDQAGPVLLVEGGSDTAAGMTAQLSVIGRPSNLGGVELLAEFIELDPGIPDDRPIIVLGENDRLKDGQPRKSQQKHGATCECGECFPGLFGAKTVCERLAESLRRPVRWAMPPDGAKDLREWLRSQGDADPQELGRLFVSRLKTEIAVENDDSESDVKDGPTDRSFPTECLRPPGLIGEIVDYTLSTAKYPQPEHALAGALALMSLATGRRVCDATGTRTNLNIIALGPTRSGKEHPRQINKKLLEVLHAEHMYEEKLASHSSLHGFLKSSPAGLLMNDEFGDFLALARSTKGPNTQAAQIVSAIIKLYSSSNGLYKADRYADNAKQITIDQPHLVLYGTSTEEIFWKHVTPDYLSGGFFGRTIIFENRGYVDPQPLLGRDQGRIPDSIIRQLSDWLNCFSHYDQSWWEHPSPFIAPHSEEARQRFEQHELDISQKRKGESPIRAALWSGTAEITAKLSLLFACSRSMNPLQIEMQDVDLAVRMSNWLTRRKVELSQDNVAENQVESNAKRVYRLIKNAGVHGMDKSTLTRRTQWLRPKERDEILINLQSGGQIEFCEIKTATKTKTVFRARELLKSRD